MPRLVASSFVRSHSVSTNSMALLLYSEHNKSLADERDPTMDEKYSLNTEKESIYNTWAHIGMTLVSCGRSWDGSFCPFNCEETELHSNDLVHM